MATRILIRTHYFDDTIARLHEKWSRILPDGVGILMDETRGPIDVAGLPKVVFDLKALEARGLPAWPEGKAAWHCGDYVMGAVEPHMADDDFVLVVENDAVPGIASLDRWRSVIADLARHDLAVYRYRLRAAGWMWLRNVERVYGPGRQFGAIIVVLGFTKATARLMTARRIEIAEARRREGFDDWPHCELFVGAEAKRAKLAVADIGIELPSVRETLTTARPYLFDDIIGDDTVDTIYHPVTNNREKYIAKVCVLIRGRTPAEIVHAKIARLGELTAAEQRRLDVVRRRVAEERAATPG